MSDDKRTTNSSSGKRVPFYDGINSSVIQSVLPRTPPSSPPPKKKKKKKNG